MAQESGIFSDISSEKTIKEIEGEIDQSFALNALKNEGYAQSVWTLLSVNEDRLLKVFDQQQEELDIFIDISMNALTYPLRVCHSECPDESRELAKELIDEHYELAWNWLDLASYGYYDFHFLFPLWHRGKLEVAVEGKRLSVVTRRENKSYEAYNRLILADAKPRNPQILSTNIDALVAPKTTRGEDWFRVNFDPQLVTQLVSAMTPVVAHQHSLPDEWTFGDFTLAQFRTVMTTVRAMMSGWFVARKGLARAGMLGMGYKSSIWVVPKEEFTARLRAIQASN